MGKKKRAGKGGRGADTAADSSLDDPAAITVDLGVCPAVVPPGAGAAPFSQSVKVTHLLQDKVSPTIIVAEPILSEEECLAWIEWGEAAGFALEKHGQTSQIAHRDNGRIAVHADEIAGAIFQRLVPWLPAVLSEGQRPTGCHPNIRLYKYTVGQRFGKHVDVANDVNGGTTEFTALFYLNDDGLVGGDTVFYKSHYGSREVLRFAPRAGAALLHAHGDRCLTHEGAAVTAGVKYLLRTDVVYAPS